MKAAFLTLLLCATTATAEIVRPIDPRRQADVNKQPISAPTIRLDTLPQSNRSLPQPSRSLPVSPLTGQRVVPGATVELGVVDTATLQTSTLTSRTVPQANFIPKRATAPRTLPAAGTVQTSPADIKKRVIHANTPAGAEELKKQLNSPLE